MKGEAWKKRVDRHYSAICYYLPKAQRIDRHILAWTTKTKRQENDKKKIHHIHDIQQLIWVLFPFVVGFYFGKGRRYFWGIWVLSSDNFFGFHFKTTDLDFMNVFLLQFQMDFMEGQQFH